MTYWKTWFTAALITTSVPTVAQGAIQSDSIPTILVADEDPVDYPDPICSKCSILLDDDEDSAGARASLWIEYPLEDSTFSGSIEVTVWLDDDEPRTVWIDDVVLESGKEVELSTDAESDWSWDEVRLVWLRFEAE